MLQPQAGAQVPLDSCGYRQHSSLLSQLAYQGLHSMFQSQAGAQWGSSQLWSQPAQLPAFSAGIPGTSDHVAASGWCPSASLQLWSLQAQQPAISASIPGTLDHVAASGWCLCAS